MCDVDVDDVTDPHSKVNNDVDCDLTLQLGEHPVLLQAILTP